MSAAAGGCESIHCATDLRRGPRAHAHGRLATAAHNMLRNTPPSPSSAHLAGLVVRSLAPGIPDCSRRFRRGRSDDVRKRSQQFGATAVDVGSAIVADEAVGAFVAAQQPRVERGRFGEAEGRVVVGELEARADVVGNDHAPVRDVERVADDQSVQAR